MISKRIIKIKHLTHKGNETLALFFEKDFELIGIVKKLPGARFSATHICWYIPKREKLLDEILTAFDGKAWVDYAALREPDFDLKKEKPRPNDEATAMLRLMEQKLHLKGYTKATTKTYLD